MCYVDMVIGVGRVPVWVVRYGAAVFGDGGVYGGAVEGVWARRAA